MPNRINTGLRIREDPNPSPVCPNQRWAEEGIYGPTGDGARDLPAPLPSPPVINKMMDKDNFAKNGGHLMFSNKREGKSEINRLLLRHSRYRGTKVLEWYLYVKTQRDGGPRAIE